ncbi:MAG: Metallo-peptidase family M12B Reprolysin-like [uncultured Thiotrichaceae bacterium]|uniref:Metallo-peptidase family M12B Reprolysin-like n=1 Tax=uncultured Thiotrichaceae bacterium TaxID=298394 RepID=A0A6S6TGI3_9GAMM|nr:MAG: Metallo-peptidase family M12B Reprolysin-like [uncultured Thiotrichaceae bacterium]
MLLSLIYFLLPNLLLAKTSDIQPKENLNTSEQVRFLTLDSDVLKKRLSITPFSHQEKPTINFPLPNGGNIEVTAKKIKIWEKEQSHSQFWEVQSTDSANKSHGVINSTALGIHAMLVLPNKEIILLKPASLPSENNYMVQTRKSIPLSKRFEEVLYQNKKTNKPSIISRSTQQRVNYQGITEYRLAVAATGEFTEFFDSVELAQASIANMISHVNVIYERDLGIRFILVDNTNIIFEHPGEGFTADASLTELGEQNGKILVEHIGAENFDMGHVISFGQNIGGLAYIGGACNPDPAIKASGASRTYDPMSGAFDIDYLGHEMGHQVGATHTFNSNEGLCAGTRTPETAVEPGSGNSIMSYAGLCGIDNTRESSLSVFHIVSIEQIKQHLQQYQSCGTVVANDTNTPPNIESFDNYIIVDAGQPFTLHAQATDSDNDEISYSWDQVDAGTASHTGNDYGDNAIFQIMDPTTASQRTFPAYTVYNRDIHFRLVVRDGNGAMSTEDVTVTVVNGKDLPNTTTAKASGGGHISVGFFFLLFFLSACKLRIKEIKEAKLH